MNPKARELAINLKVLGGQFRNPKQVYAMWQGAALTATIAAKEDIFAEAVFFYFKDQFDRLTTNNPRKIVTYDDLADELDSIDYSESVYYFTWDNLINVISMFEENSVFIKTLIHLINGYRY